MTSRNVKLYKSQKLSVTTIHSSPVLRNGAKLSIRVLNGLRKVHHRTLATETSTDDTMRCGYFPLLINRVSMSPRIMKGASKYTLHIGRIPNFDVNKILIPQSARIRPSMQQPSLFKNPILAKYLK